MFKALKDDKIIAINDTGEFPCLVYDTVDEDAEHQISDYVHCDGEFVLTTSDPAIEQYKAQKRAERDAKIETYEWRMSRYERQKAINIETTDTEETYLKLCQYIQDLRDITKQDKWWSSPILTFEKWKEDLNAKEQVKTMGDVYGTV